MPLESIFSEHGTKESRYGSLQGLRLHDNSVDARGNGDDRFGSIQAPPSIQSLQPRPKTTTTGITATQIKMAIDRAIDRHQPTAPAPSLPKSRPRTSAACCMAPCITSQIVQPPVYGIPNAIAVQAPAQPPLAPAQPPPQEDQPPRHRPAVRMERNPMEKIDMLNAMMNQMSPFGGYQMALDPMQLMVGMGLLMVVAVGCGAVILHSRKSRSLAPLPSLRPRRRSSYQSTTTSGSTTSSCSLDDSSVEGYFIQGAVPMW